MQVLLAELLQEFQANLRQLSGWVPRDIQIPEVNNKIKVAIGMRRVGKTYLLYQKIQALLDEGIPLTRILYINFEDDRLLPLTQKSLAQLLESFYALYPENHEQRCYFFLDEIQNVEEWPLVIRRFFDSKPVEIFLTGSSAKLLSKEIATSLRGRSLATQVWPYSFKEYLQAKSFNLETTTTIVGRSQLDKLKKELTTYLMQGGFPEVCNYNDSIRQQTLQDYVHVVTLRDIVERHKITNLVLIKYLIKRLLHDTSTSCSMNKMYNDLKSQGYTVGKDTLYDYVSYLEDAYLCFSVPLYSESLRKSQINPKKNYAIDTGLVKAYTLSFSDNLGRMFENLIYLDLRREGCDAFYYLTQDERFEVDFVAVDQQGRSHLFQVAWDISDAETYQRECRALEIATKELNMPGHLITPEVYLRRSLSTSLFNV
jgi:predicted AAA+ superfamily ATPase